MLPIFAVKGEGKGPARKVCTGENRRLCCRRNLIQTFGIRNAAAMAKNSQKSTETPASLAAGPTSATSSALVVSVVIPCYREKDHIMEVIGGIGPEVGRIFVIDDACPEKTGDYVRENCRDSRVEVLSHERNTGVGGATMTGYRRALEAGAGIIVKLDGDGQMDPAMIPTLIQPLAGGEADYAKGNRFHQLRAISAMPAMRITGNMLLSFASKLSSGYWDIFDPTNGFTAIHAKVVRALPLDRISQGFFFESDMLFQLGLMRAAVTDVPMQARYGKEKSAISIPKIIPEFLFKHTINTWKRIFFSYFVREFTFASLQLVGGMVMLSFGILFGGYWWVDAAMTGVPASTGTVILAALTIILGSQFLISFINHDTGNVPKTPVHPLL